MPMKGLATALSDSHRVVPITFCKIHPSFKINHCIAPIYDKICTMKLKKKITGIT